MPLSLLRVTARSPKPRPGQTLARLLSASAGSGSSRRWVIASAGCSPPRAATYASIMRYGFADERQLLGDIGGRAAVTIAYARALIEAGRSGEPYAADDMADLLEHLLDRAELTVAEALGGRLAEPTPVWIRGALIQEYAESIGKLSSVRAQAQAVLAAARRPPVPKPEGTESESLLVSRLREIGVGDLSERTVRRILGAR